MSSLSFDKQQACGIGLGLRAPHFNDIISHRPPIAWFEALTDNYLQSEPARKILFKIREHYPMTLHGVGLSLGSSDPLNQDYLLKLKKLADALQPAWISEHLCWISARQHYTHQLLPLPYTEEAIAHVVTRVKQVQDFLGRKILLENVSAYLDFTDSYLTEWEFINAVAEQADCNILLDLNNIYVSSHNQQFAPDIYLTAIKPERVKQFHLAGYERFPNYLLDAHNDFIAPPVWELYRLALKRFGDVPTLIEWDTQIPSWAELLKQANLAQEIYDSIITSEKISEV